MLARLLGIENADALRGVELTFRRGWPEFVLVLLLALGAAYAVHVYWREKAISRRMRVLLTALRALLVALLILLFFQPALALQLSTRLRGNILVLLDTSESMTFQDPRTRREEQLDAALALGRVSFKAALNDPGLPLPAEARNPARRDLARAVLAHPELKLLDQLREEYELRYFAFGERLEPTVGEGETQVKGLLQKEAAGKATELGSAVEEALARHSGQPISGLIVLTDGAWNKGKDPLEVARELGQRRVPIHPVGLGLPAPPDIWVQNLDVLETVFSGDQVTVHVQLRSRAFRGRSTALRVFLDGVEVQQKVVLLKDAGQFEELSFVAPARSATMKLEVVADALPGETVTENNRAEKMLRVLDERIKVLYVEGAPRWEYRYLRTILMRDRRLVVKFLITEGDPDLARYSLQYLDRFPEDAAQAFLFDMVILGDVAPNYFSARQLARLQDLVKSGGASLLVLAGPLYCPGAYSGTPLLDMLPVRVPADAREQLAEDVHPVVTAAGYRSATAVLDPVPARNDLVWQLVRHLCYVPRLGGAKPGAHVLLELSDAARRAEPYPLVAWQQYGAGKVMFVGADQLWRLRFKTGDRYHARFWGQTIRFLSLARLLGGNKRVNLQTDKPSYEARDKVVVFAHVLNEAFEPLKVPAYAVRAEKQGLRVAGRGVRRDNADGASSGMELPQTSTLKPQTSVPVRLEPVPDRPGFYQGLFVPDEDGRYALLAEPQDQPFANQASFDVTTQAPEYQELAMQQQLLQEIAARSGGRYFSIRELPELPAQFQKETRASVVQLERELWDTPLVFLLILACAGAEWFLRRRYDLA